MLIFFLTCTSLLIPRVIFNLQSFIGSRWYTLQHTTDLLRASIRQPASNSNASSCTGSTAGGWLDAFAESRKSSGRGRIIIIGREWVIARVLVYIHGYVLIYISLRISVYLPLFSSPSLSSAYWLAGWCIKANWNMYGMHHHHHRRGYTCTYRNCRNTNAVQQLQCGCAREDMQRER